MWKYFVYNLLFFSPKQRLRVRTWHIKPRRMLDEDTKLEEGGDLPLVLQRRLLTPLLSKKVPPITQDADRKPYPEFTANFFSRIFFWWLGPVMRLGYKRTLQPNDLFYLPDNFKVELFEERYSAIRARRMARAKASHLIAKCKSRGETLETSSVDTADDLEDFKIPKSLNVLAILETFKWRYAFSCACLTLANVGATVNPLLAKKLIAYVQRKAIGQDSAAGQGVGYAIGTSLLVLVGGILVNHYFYHAMMTGALVKGVLTKSMLDKSFRLNAESRSKFSPGKITSMMGTDLSRIDFALGFQPFIITFPIPIIIAIAILIDNIGVSALVGIGLLVLYMVFIMICAKYLFSYRAQANIFTDARVNHIKEVLNNLKIIKFYSWEPPYRDKITDIRKKEMSILFRMQLVRDVIICMAISLATLTSLVTFLVLYGIGNIRDPAAIFSSISLFGILSQQVIMVPMALATGMDGFLGLIRVSDYLAAPETDVAANRIEASPEKAQDMKDKCLAIEVKDADFEWEVFDHGEEDDKDSKNDKKDKEVKKEKKNKKKNGKEKNTKTETKTEVVIEKVHSGKDSIHTKLPSSSSDQEDFKGLKNINLEIKKGEFIVVTGLIGSGKTSFLNALSGFMNRTHGQVNVEGSLLLCGYPWVQNATVKENIIFGKELDEKKYRDVVYACSLESDLDILPAGDKTEIGERGITLSGGQKARINLARAVYHDSDIILLDDVLSAVDARVGKHIMNNCILGLLKSRTRILATHQLSLIGSADRIVFLNGDGSISVGTSDELKVKNAAFDSLMAYNSESKEENEDEKEVNEKTEFEEDMENEKELIQRQLSKTQTREQVATDEEAEHRDFNLNKTDDGKLITIEERAVNTIGWPVYRDYIKYGSGKLTGWGIVPIILVTVILTTFLQLFTNTWLSFWIEKKFGLRSDGFYIGFYVMFAILSVLFLFIEFIFFVYLTNRASRVLNIIAVKRVLHTPMSYMDTTPMGRILNRFTKDTDSLDNELGDQIRMLFVFFSNIVGVLILCIIYLPWFAIAVPFLIFIFVAISNFYQASAREIKRLEAVQRSLVYNNFNETLNGMNTIKAFKSQFRFKDKNNFFINKMNEAYFITIANQRWLGIHLDMIATVLALIVSFLCVFRVFDIGPASVGLLISYVLQISGQLSMLIKTFTTVENEMNAVERICSYAFNLPQEAAYTVSETTPPPNWPTEGAIKFEDISLAYRPGLPLVLKDLNLEVGGGKKIGICGRTGAGKSSIMTALYRLSELASGKIEIDGIDISTLGLNELRSRLSIIPQDPVLFKGSIRKNLDPFDQSSDDKLWDALRRAGLIEDSKLFDVKNQDKNDENLHKFHLNQDVDNDGDNFSLGERQLIAFARALVRDSKILILDEATSSVDYETDSKIQSTIFREFGHCTILCIAHRLKTILNYDKIVVLDKGEIREFDTPINLFNTENSIFQQMCKRSNVTIDDFRGHDKT